MSYFAHNTNTRNDERVVALRMKHGAAGYGIYIMLIEKMYENADLSLTRDYTLLAYDIHAGVKKIQSVVEDFGLFEFSADGTRFTSATLHRANIEKPSSNDAPAAADIDAPTTTDDAHANTEEDKACETNDESATPPVIETNKPATVEFINDYDNLLDILHSPANKNVIMKLSEIYKTTPEHVLEVAAEVIAEWKISKPRYSNYDEVYTHLSQQVKDLINLRRETNA